MAGDAAPVSMASASSLVLLQLASRCFTFVLNQLLVRLVSPQVFGTAAIQFELLLSTILFLSREGVRNALLRAPPGTHAPRDDHARAQPLVDNIALLPVLLGVPIALLSAHTYLRCSAASTAAQPFFTASVRVYAAAALCELLAEPLYIRAQNALRVGVRVRAEGAAVAAKALTAFLVLVLAPPECALLAFAAGQAAYGLVTLGVFLRVYGRSARWTLRRVETEVHGNVKSQYFDTALLHLSAAMTGQSVIKHFLTEGDKFLVSRLSPLADQGGYAVASNYGSLVARIIFQPIEETSRIFFSKTLSSSAKSTPEALRAASDTLLSILLLFTHLLLLLAAFAPPYLPLALALALPRRYLATSAPAILRVYIYYIPTMAYNGVLEAFLASAAAPADLRAQSRWLLACSLAFVGGALLARAARLGDAGLVWAGVAALGLRAGYAWRFARRYFAARGAPGAVRARRAVPPFGVLATFAVAAAVTRISAGVFRDAPLTVRGQCVHVAIGASCLAQCAVACFIWEREFFGQAVSLLRRR